MPRSLLLPSEKRDAKEYKVLIKFLLFGFVFVYAGYTRLFPDDVPINAEIIALHQPETSEVISYHSTDDYVKLILVIEGVSKSSNNFTSRKVYYLNKTLEFTCNNSILKSQLADSKFVLIDLLTSQYESSQFANMRISSDDCVNGI